MARTVIKQRTERKYYCVETGVELAYFGRGRPPLYSPEVAKRRAADARREAARRAAVKRRGETVDPASSQTQ